MVISFFFVSQLGYNDDQTQNKVPLQQKKIQLHVFDAFHIHILQRLALISVLYSMIQYTHTKNMYVFPSDLARFSMIVVYSVDLWMRVYCRHRRLLILVAVSWILNRVLCVC